MAPRWLALALVSVAPDVAWAHAFGKSFSDTKVNGAEVSLFFDYDPDDLQETLRARFDDDRSGVVELPELLAHEARLATLGRAAVVVKLDGERCQSELVSHRVSEEAGMVRVHLAYRCPAAGPLELHVALLDQLRDGHTHLATLRLAGGVRGEILTREAPTFLEGGGGSFWRFLHAGIHHILVGYDHLLFLLGLLLVARRPRQIALIVTGFTAGHSVTLALAALDVVSLPAALVEPVIAASIVYVGVENLWRGGGPHRPYLALGLGLVHGFGFAGVLREMGLPAGGRAVPLVAFNLGVEVGQLVVFAVALPVVRLLERKLGGRVVTAGSLVVAALGGVWLVLRVAGL